MKVCRCCGEPLSTVFVDLGKHPSANRFLKKANLAEPEPMYSLKVFVCDKCLLVQIPEENQASDIFVDDYVYFSSYSAGWVAHAQRYADEVTERFKFDDQSFVIEVASNDGYLLQHFVEAGIPCLGIDPATETARVAAKKGVETVIDFFTAELARKIVDEYGQVDLVCGTNVFAHVPAVNDFVEGLEILLKPGGIVTLEFPHLARLIENVQFDTIYDEHFSYFSFAAAQYLLRSKGLEVFDVEEHLTHGGSLRVFARKNDNVDLPAQPAVAALLEKEAALGLDSLAGYEGFQDRVTSVRNAFLEFLEDNVEDGVTIAAFGAAAKGNTFLNYCEVGADTILFVADDTLAKQGKYLPKSHIPVLPESEIRKARPDFVLILPWNVKDEIVRKLGYIREWGGRFVTCIPDIKVF
jgi:SAM-dependent methyltransferase